eukprot:TRINITY_DN406_c0_g1_i20.p1 TRINITY_DN406_c0_g1~~TRINITY_DN406_c0_g1_i20.p1  ORF type:complete len:323 (+),score=51.76 TRINITY_DN406_c0_g1_i20:103-1071(+)
MFSRYVRDLCLFQFHSSSYSSYKRIERVPRPEVTDSFTFMTYNVLSRMTVDSITYCKPEFLALEYRRKSTLKEIREHDPDICCLQELDRTEYVDHYSTVMASLGYLSVYRVSGRSFDSEGHGSCIFWKQSKFKYVEHIEVEYYSLVNTLPVKFINREFITFIKRLFNVGIVIMLEFDKIQKFIAKFNKVGTGIPIVLGGDFNSLPESGPYLLMKEGKLSHNHVDLTWQKSPIIWEDLVHGNPLTSVYGSTVGEPKFTNFTDVWTGTIDYIWFLNSHLTPISLKYLIDSQTASKEIALPNRDFPSDHLSLCCELGVKGKKDCP